jgi:hypothetical protein
LYYQDARVLTYLNTFDKGYFYSTTSADYYKAQNNFFSTTSASYFASQGLAFSTTSSAYFLSQNQGAAFSTTSADYYANASSTIAKTYSNNTFTGANVFATFLATGSSTLQNFTGVNATTSQATTTRFAISSIASSLLKTQADGSVVAAIAGVDYAAVGASNFGKSFELVNGSLVPTTTVGIIVSASSTFSGGLTVSNSTTTNATSTTFNATTLTATNASTSALVASNSFTFGSVSGFLKATGGVVASSLVNLAADVTGVLPATNGGTGWAAVQAGTLLYGNGAGSLSTTTQGTAGQVLALLGGVPTWTATTTFSAPLVYSNGSVSITQSNGATNGYLSSGDWTIFNNKVGSTSIDTSTELANLVTDETGSGALVFGTAPSISNGSFASTTLTGVTAFNTIVGNLATVTGATTTRHIVDCIVS